MYHSKPTPEEILKLDCLLHILADQESFIQAYDLVECAGYSKVGPSIEKEFEYLLTIFRDCSAARVQIEPDNNMAFYNDNTLRFLKDGGFQAYFQRLDEERRIFQERVILEFEKSPVDLALAKKFLKDYRWTKIFARVGFGVSILVALFEIIKLIFY